MRARILTGDQGRRARAALERILNSYGYRYIWLYRVDWYWYTFKRQANGEWYFHRMSYGELNFRHGQVYIQVEDDRVTAWMPDKTGRYGLFNFYLHRD